MRLLVVDDDAAFAKTVAKFLTRQNYLVDIATDGQIAWELVQSHLYDLIVLDVMLPRLDGVGLCQRLRQQGNAIPVLVLTARSSSTDKVIGLEAGADDYMSKPFDWSELLARIRALLRRESSITSPMLTWGPLSLDRLSCQVCYAGQSVDLRPREHKLLELLLRNPSRVFSCSAILENLWSFEDPPSEDTVRAHIKGLRQKLKTVGAQNLIETVYGLGYRLQPLEDPQPSQLTEVVQTPTAEFKELQQALAEAWQEVQPEILERVAFLEQVIDRHQAGVAEIGLQQRAIAEAHKLAGTVGSYGFKLGSQIARQIEADLQGDRLNSEQAADLQAQIAALRQELSSDLPTAAPVSPGPQPAVFRSRIGSARILAVDDDPQMLTTLKTVLEPWGLSLTALSDSRQFWQSLTLNAPDLLLLDVVMPQPNGLQLCERVRSDPDWAGLPVMFLTAYTDATTVQRVFMSGADDFVSKSILGPELVTRIAARLDRHRFWQRLSEHDQLTQLAHRSKFTRDLQQLLQTAEQHQQPCSLMLLQIDSLAAINHRYGYLTGDTVLSQIGARLARLSTARNLVARWSGSKFAIALYGTLPTEAERQLSKVLSGTQVAGWIATDGSPLQLSVTIGTASYPNDGHSVQALYHIAERSLVA